MSSAGTSNYSVSVILSAFDKATAPIKMVTQSLAGATSRVRVLSESFSDDKAFKNFQFHMKGTEKATTDAIFSMSKALKDYLFLFGGSTLAFGLLGKVSFDQFSEFSKSTLEFTQSAKRVGLGVAELKGYKFAAEASGTSLDSIESVFNTMSEKRLALQTNSLSASDPIFKLPGGFNFFDKDTGMLKSTQQLVLDLSDKIKSLPNDHTKSSVLKLVVGSDSSFELMSKGQNEIKKQLTEAKKYTLPEDQERRAEQSARVFSSAAAKIKSVFESLKTQFMNEVLPGVSQAIEGIVSIIVSKQEALNRVFRQIGQSLPKEIDSAVNALRIFGNTFEWLSSTVGVVNFVSIIASLTVLSSTLKAFLSLKTALMEFFALWTSLQNLPIIASFGAMLAEGPLLVAVGVLAALSAGILYAYNNWDKVVALFDWGFNKILGLCSVLGDAFKELFTNPFKGLDAEVGLNKFQQTTTIHKLITDSNPTKNLNDLIRTQGKSDSDSNNGQQAPTQIKQTSEVVVRLENAPQGTRVEKVKGDVPVQFDVGYSSFGFFRP